jgi:diaminohydroxyphosphoribosylaminopyrimidine deaminase / 5-amino-6-(5-phosphoribosylamino)uracil reductase
MLEHPKYMHQCLNLAVRAAGRTAPNPLVGAVVVDDSGNVIASGFHKKAGEAHAEIEALNQAGEQAKGKTLYVNLEPCCHHGRTPPCTDSVIASGVKRVVYGMSDPNPKVAGGGIKALQEAGIEVIGGVLANESKMLNRAFIKWVTHKQPWIILKMASTLDGKIADRMGGSRWVSGEEARRHVHHLRNSCDGVMVGGRTVEIDNPELTVRDIPDGRNPLRIIIDTSLKTRPDAKVCRLSESDSKTVIFARAEESANTSKYSDKVKLVATARAGDHLDLQEVMRRLAMMNLLSVLCEGGASLAGALLDQNLVDEVHWIVALKLIGDVEAKQSLAGTAGRLIQESLPLQNPQVQTLGRDLLIRGFLRSV